MDVVNTQAIALPTYQSGNGKASLYENGLQVTLLAVLTQGTAGDYAVYVGAAHLPIPGKNMDLYHIARNDAAAWIAHMGTKQTYLKAIQFFPGLEKSEYRI